MAINTKSNTMHVRINPEIKSRAVPVLNDMGISIGDLFNMVLAQVANQRRVPFELVDSTHVPNQTTIDAMLEARALISKRATSYNIDDALEELKS